MSSRPKSQPPQLPGFRHIGFLGSGGFADVFLYEQDIGHRQVAIKVLLSDVRDAQARARFDGEANLMAQLSSHPRIVTVFQTGVASDGRPFLVMEYCPKPSLDERYKKSPLSVDEALRTGIELAGAVETMHRAGIWHRDIKPANVLLTEYRRPAITDFGISVAEHDADTAQGLSVPWSPPEVLTGQAAAGRPADVYSLAATVYSLLAGRTPFEQPGGDNRRDALIDRIKHTALPPVGRADVAPELDQVLATAMAKAPAARYPSAISFARALQNVQSRMRLPVTQIEVREDSAVVEHEETEDDGRTVLRPVTTIDPVQISPPPVDTTMSTGGTSRTSVTGGTHATGTTAPGPVVDATLRRSPTEPGPDHRPAPVARDFRGPGLGEPPVAETWLREVAEPEMPALAPARRRSPLVAAVAAVVLVVATVGVLLALRSPASHPAADGGGSSSSAPVDAVGAAVPVPTSVTGTPAGGQVVFSWVNPDPQQGDSYLYRVPDPAAEAPLVSTTATTATVPAVPGARACLEVTLRRADGTASATPGKGCTQP